MKAFRTALGLSFLLAACSGGSGFRIGAGTLSSSQYLTADDLGLPVGGLIDPSSSFEPLLREDGVALVAESLQASQVVTNVEDNETLDLAPGSRIAIVARNGEWLRIVAKVKDSQGREKIIEGFVKARDVSYLGPETEGHAIDLMPAFVAAAEAAQGIEGNLNSRSVTEGVVSGSESSFTPTLASGSAAVVSSLGSSQSQVPSTAAASSTGAGSNVSQGVSNPEASVGSSSAAAPQATNTSTADTGPKPEPKPQSKPKPKTFDDGGKLTAGSCEAVVFRSEGNKFDCSSRAKIRQVRGGRGGVPGKNGVASKNVTFDDRVLGCVVPGELLRSRGDEDTGFQITAKATKIRVIPKASGFVCVGSKGNQCEEHYKKVYAPKVIDVSANDEVHNIALNQVLGSDNRLIGGNRTFTFRPLDNDGNETGSCTLNMTAVSPVVLDLANVGHFEGLNLGESNVQFDFLGTGRAAATGWVSPSMGLLAIDLNRDGAISNGTELFGEGTRKPDGSTFTNGYDALAAHDDNRDGIIDSRDPVFQKLVVWRDVNVDARSSPSELIPLSKLGITALSVVYGPSFRHGAPALGQNDVRYESRYFGPQKCGKEGCLSFDVFFATGSVVADR